MRTARVLTKYSLQTITVKWKQCIVPMNRIVPYLLGCLPRAGTQQRVGRPNFPMQLAQTLPGSTGSKLAENLHLKQRAQVCTP